MKFKVGDKVKVYRDSRPTTIIVAIDPRVGIIWCIDNGYDLKNGYTEDYLQQYDSIPFKGEAFVCDENDLILMTRELKATKIARLIHKNNIEEDLGDKLVVRVQYV